MDDGAEILVRPGAEEDLAPLTEIYNHYVRATAVTFDVQPLLPEQRRPWLVAHPEDGPHRLMVAQRVRDGRVLGYATSSRFRERPAYATSVEVSAYLAPDAVGRGVGSLLYRRLFAALEDEDVHRAYAGVALPNDASVRLHRRFGFQVVGTYREVGRKFGRYHDVQWFEKPLGG